MNNDNSYMFLGPLSFESYHSSRVGVGGRQEYLLPGK